MRKSSILRVAVLSGVAAGGWGLARAAGGPHAAFARTVVDLGPVKAAESARLSFPLRNTGSAPLEILSVDGDCGCIRPSFPKRVPAGGSAAIDGVFEAEPMWGGKMEKTLRVRTNDASQGEIRLTVKMDVVPFVRMEPRTPLVLQFDPGKTYTQDVVLTPRAGGNIRLSSPKCEQSFVHASLLPASAQDGKGSQRLRLTVGPVTQPGDFTATVKLATTEPKLPEAWFVIAGLAKSGPVVSPAQVVLPSRSAGEMAGELARVQVLCRTGSVRVLGVETGTPFLKAEVVEKAPGHLSEVVVRGTGRPKPGPLRASLKLRTDYKATPVVQVPFSVVVNP